MHYLVRWGEEVADTEEPGGEGQEDEGGEVRGDGENGAGGEEFEEASLEPGGA